MAWDYVYGIRLDSEGSSTAFGAAVDDVRIPNEMSPGVRSRPAVVANRHGSVTASRRFFDSYDFVLEVTLSYGSPETPATVYQNRSTVLSRMTHHLETVWLTRTAPHQGTVEIPIEVTRTPRTTNPRHRLAFVCRTLDPFWRDTSVTFNAVNPVSGVTVGGDAPIGDGVFVLSGGTNQVLTHTASGDTITIAGSSTPAITVDLGGQGGGATFTQSGSPADSVVTMSAPWGIELQPGSNAHTLTGGGSATFTGRDKWL